MALNIIDITRLRRVGFIEDEIDYFDRAVDPAGNPQHLDLDSKVWRNAMRSRSAWRREQRRRGVSDDRIVRAIRNYYAMGKGRSPFDFIRQEYRPPRKLTDYEKARKARAKAGVKKWSPSYSRR